jgi:Photosynthetic reaction centre cytochrome C subunit
VIALLLITLAATQPDLPVERTKKNIKVLQGVPSSQLIPVMAFMSNSLGVTCAHCHGSQWESDEKAAKEVARKHIVLQRTLNEQQFGGELIVTCNTCHHGRAKPTSTPDVAHAGWQTAPAASPTIAAEEAIAALPQSTATRRMIRGTVERYSGREEPKSAPFTLEMQENGDYQTELSHPPEAARALAIYSLPRPRAEQVAGERWIVTPASIKRMREIATPLGPLPEQIEYSDFRDTDSGRLPFRAQWSRADYRVTFTIERIESRTLQVLHDIPESHLFLAMNAVAQSLGVRCDYCHVKRGDTWIWAAEDKPMKQVARNEMKMLRSGVTCYTCHRGSTSVARIYPLPPRDPEPQKPSPALPSAEEVLQRYRAAVGVSEPKPLVMRGAIDSRARRGPFEVAVTPPNTFAFTFNGATQTASDERATAMYAIDKVRNVNASAMKVTGIETIDGRDAYVADSGGIQYFFDTHTGLLLRRIKTFETVLGPLPDQIDFEDYRNVDGTMVPFVIRTSNAAPFDTATRTFTEIVVAR